VRELVKDRDRVRRSARDLAGGHGARQFRHWLTSTSRAHGGAGCSGIRLLGGTRVGVPHAWCARKTAPLYDTAPITPGQPYVTGIQRSIRVVVVLL
jgi:hypothetical protein